MPDKADEVLNSLGKTRKVAPTPTPSAEETKRLADEQAAEVERKRLEEENKNKVPSTEMADDVLLSELKRRGIQVEKVDQLTTKVPTESEKAEVIKKKKDAAFNYAINNNIYSKDDLVAYEKDRDRSAHDIAYDIFKQDFIEGIKGTPEEAAYKDETGAFKDEDIRELFDEQNFPGEDEASGKRKFRNTQYEKMKNSYLENKYGKILKADKVYDDYQTEMSQATQYKGIVDNAFGKLPAKLKYTVNGVDVDFTPSPEALQHVKEVYLNPKAYASVGKDATEETLLEAFKLTIAQKDMTRLLQEAAETYHATQVRVLKLGRIGAPPSRDGGQEAGSAPGDSKTKNADAVIAETKKK